jgi:hypothetical protein
VKRRNFLKQPLLLGVVLMFRMEGDVKVIWVSNR